MSDQTVPFSPRVARLLTLGMPEELNVDGWSNYPALYDLGAEDIESLIAMACDASLYHSDVDDLVLWAPVHAWRALGQLCANAAIEPLLAFAEAVDDEWVRAELPNVLGMIGEAAIASLAACLSDPSRARSGRSIAIFSLGRMGTRHPETRLSCVTALAGAVAMESDPRLAGYMVAVLLDLKAVEAIDEIRTVFARDMIDVSIAGDMEDVEIDLGLRTERVTPARNYFAEKLGWAFGKPDVTPQVPVTRIKIGRNEACPCGSGKKYKKCCLGK